MVARELREFKRRSLFKPFTIHMDDGRQFRVDDPESLVLPRDWCTDAIVTMPRGRFAFIYLRNVTHVASERPWPKMRRRRRGNGSDQT